MRLSHKSITLSSQTMKNITSILTPSVIFYVILNFILVGLRFICRYTNGLSHGQMFIFSMASQVTCSHIDYNVIYIDH